MVDVEQMSDVVTRGGEDAAGLASGGCKQACM